ncbi:hypothetical protein KKF38_01905 [Patescibacteria group bacterium]|nr:hypothetical protein [Patescibacteria group bacterium]
MAAFKPQITKTISAIPDIPAGVKVGDFIVARYTSSQWADEWYAVDEDWDHAALISNLRPLKIIEVSGIPIRKDKKEGVVEYEFQKPRENGNNWLTDKLIKMKWLRPIFPDPIREKDHWLKPRTLKKKITEEEARKRAIKYARAQIGESFNGLSSKWNTEGWYCSKLIFKAYSLSITDMYLESYLEAGDILTKPIIKKISSGYWVTPEDLVDSKRSEVYYTWYNENHLKHARK